MLILNPISVALILLIIFCGIVLYLVYKSIQKINQHLIKTIDSMTKVLDESRTNLKNTNKLLIGINKDNQEIQPSIKAINQVSKNISDVSNGLRKAGTVCKNNSKIAWHKAKKLL